MSVYFNSHNWHISAQFAASTLQLGCQPIPQNIWIDHDKVGWFLEAVEHLYGTTIQIYREQDLWYSLFICVTDYDKMVTVNDTNVTYM